VISEARPDIFGLNNAKQVFAVEVKGLTDYKKAIFCSRQVKIS